MFCYMRFRTWLVLSYYLKHHFKQFSQKYIINSKQNHFPWPKIYFLPSITIFYSTKNTTFSKTQAKNTTSAADLPVFLLTPSAVYLEDRSQLNINKWAVLGTNVLQALSVFKIEFILCKSLPILFICRFPFFLQAFKCLKFEHKF